MLTVYILLDADVFKFPLRIQLALRPYSFSIQGPFTFSQDRKVYACPAILYKTEILD